MRQSILFTKTKREPPKDEEAINAKLLIRAGFVDKVMAGVYSFLPLGFRVLKKIENIIREEMNAAGGQEIIMPVLHPKEVWEKTGRWSGFDALYKVKGKDGREMALGPTHEEIIVPLAKKFINSYKDLPAYLYQIQIKFRDETRVKSGLLRGREFLMKDLYSFHSSQEDLDNYYEKMKKVYQRVFKRCGLNTIITEASGGTFSKYSHEFQVLSEAGEDTIYWCEKCGWAQNREIFGGGSKCPKCGAKLKIGRAIEVGNIFKLGAKYSEPFDLKFKTKDGKEQIVIMGCYGVGLGRILGAVVEVSHDDNGIIWPENVSPFNVHLLAVSDKRKATSDKIYQSLQKTKIEVLYDDRNDVSAGEKFADADLIGVPWRAVISEKTGDKIEVKKRDEKKTKLISGNGLLKLFQKRHRS
ncbi:MAG: aminoacyl--tRNA ligase-related protein [Patescibacteria group bacterium]